MNLHDFNAILEKIAAKREESICIVPPVDATRNWIVRVGNDYAVGETLEEALMLLFDKLNA